MSRIIRQYIPFLPFLLFVVAIVVLASRVWTVRAGPIKDSTSADVIIRGQSAGDAAGSSLAVGDLNGDGRYDLVIGAPKASPQGRPGAGIVYVMYSSASLTGTLELGSSASVTITGNLSNSEFGNALAVGDVNHDQYADLVVGAFRASTQNGSKIQFGEVYIFYGGPTLSGTIDLATHSPDVLIRGQSQYDWFGRAVAVGDVDGDGIGDVVVGAPNVNSDGAVYVFRGGTLTANMDAETEADMIVRGVPDSFGETGTAVAAEDVDGDHFADIMIGAPSMDGGAGSVYLIYGSNPLPNNVNLPPGANGLTIQGRDPGDHLGAALAVADVLGDSTLDLVLGAYYASHDHVNLSQAGQVYALRGGHRTGVISVAQADLTIQGKAAGDWLGTSVAAVDVLTHGKADLILGAPGVRKDASAKVGEAYVIVGNDFMPSIINLADADLTFRGINAGDEVGSALAASDLIANPKADIAVGARSAAPGGRTAAGEVYLVRGSSDGPTPTPGTPTTPTITYTPGPSSTPTLTPTPGQIPSITNTPTQSPTPSSTATASHTPTQTATSTPSKTATPTPSPTATASPSRTATHTPTPSASPTITPTYTHTPTPTASATTTPTHSPSPTPTVTLTSSPSPTVTATPTNSPSPTATATTSPTPTGGCVPPPTLEPLWVDPVTSPTLLLTQTLSIYLGMGRAITVTNEAGTVAIIGTFNAVTPAWVTVPLKPGAINHLSVRGLVEYTTGCFYTLGTVYDRYGAPLNIVQQPPTATPTATPSPTPAPTTLAGHVTLQGRPGPTGPEWVVPLTVWFSGGPPQNVSTDETGAFTIHGITPGTYDISVKNGHTLVRRTQGVSLGSGPNTVDLGVLLEGDASNDNFVDILDFSILRNTFLKFPADPGYDDRANFNHDTIVDILDFSLLRVNFLQAGDPAGPGLQASVAEAGALLATVAGTVNLSVIPATTTIRPGQIFTLELQVEAGTQPVDGVQAFLNFDPTWLQVVDNAGQPTDKVIGGTALDRELRNQVDNTLGQIDYAAGKLTGTPPSGTFVLATLRLKALAATPGATLTFNFDGTRITRATYQATLILGTATGGTVVIADPTATPTLTPTATATLTPCQRANVVQDDIIDTQDIQAVVNQWHQTYDARYDLNNDLQIDIIDVQIVAAHWGETCH